MAASSRGPGGKRLIREALVSHGRDAGRRLLVLVLRLNGSRCWFCG